MQVEFVCLQKQEFGESFFCKGFGRGVVKMFLDTVPEEPENFGCNCEKGFQKHFLILSAIFKIYMEYKMSSSTLVTYYIQGELGESLELPNGFMVGAAPVVFILIPFFIISLRNICFIDAY